MLPGNNKGSFTLEVSIVFSAVLLVVISAIYLCLMLYEQVYLQTFTDRIATRAANTWSCPNKDMTYGFVSKDSIKDTPLYWRIWDTCENAKLENIQKFAQYDFGRYSLISVKKKFMVDVKVTGDYMGLKKITVSAKSSGPNPLGNFLKRLGLKETFTFSAQSTAVINDPSEFIRNTDFALDTIVEIDNKFAGSGLQDVSGNIKETLTKTFATINKFLQ